MLAATYSVLFACSQERVVGLCVSLLCCLALLLGRWIDDFFRCWLWLLHTKFGKQACSSRWRHTIAIHKSKGRNFETGHNISQHIINLFEYLFFPRFVYGNGRRQILVSPGNLVCSIRWVALALFTNVKISVQKLKLTRTLFTYHKSRTLVVTCDIPRSQGTLKYLNIFGLATYPKPASQSLVQYAQSK